MPKLNYFKKVKRQSKRLYYLLLSFVIIMLTLSVCLFSITPIQPWAMYGGKSIKKETYKIFVAEYNQDTLNYPTYLDWKKMFFNYSIGIYNEYKRKGKHPAEIQAYPQWLERYLSFDLGQGIDTLNIKEYWVHFSLSGKIITDSVVSLIKE